MIVKFYPVTMLFNRHPPGIAILHSYPLLSLDNLFHLPPMLSTQLEDLKSVLDHVMLYIVVKLGVGFETGHVINFQHPWLKFMIQHYIKTKKITAGIRFFCLGRSI